MHNYRIAGLHNLPERGSKIPKEKQVKVRLTMTSRAVERKRTPLSDP